MSEEEQSHEEMVKTICRFLKDAPPGEYDDCAAIIKDIVGDEEPVDEAIQKSKEHWLLKNCTPIDFDGHKTLICEEARKGKNKFVDSKTNKVFKFDFISRKAIESEGEEEDGDGEETVSGSGLQVALQPQIEKFAANIRNGVCGVYDSSDGVKIVLRASAISKKNCKTGILLFHFTADENTLKGAIEFTGHFYENGNCIGSNVAEFEESYRGDDDDEKAADIAKKLNKIFDNWKSKISEGFTRLPEALNKLRRKMAISQTKVNWEQELMGTAAMATK